LCFVRDKYADEIKRSRVQCLCSTHTIYVELLQWNLKKSKGQGGQESGDRIDALNLLYLSPTRTQASNRLESVWIL
jgi:hypothetical protein